MVDWLIIPENWDFFAGIKPFQNACRKPMFLFSLVACKVFRYAFLRLIYLLELMHHANSWILIDRLNAKTFVEIHYSPCLYTHIRLHIVCINPLLFRGARRTPLFFLRQKEKKRKKRKWRKRGRGRKKGWKKNWCRGGYGIARGP